MPFIGRSGLIGDVPVALVRNAQHMTTAFKMNEKAFPWDQSSVPTDRFMMI